MVDDFIERLLVNGARRSSGARVTARLEHPGIVPVHDFGPQGTVTFEPGVNFAYYDPAKVSKLYALEPNTEMVRLAELRRRGILLDIEFLGLPGERIPLADASVDTVVSTFTLCTIPGVEEAIRGVKRVLKPGGRLIFFEISTSSDPRVRRWQGRWEPIHRRLFEGLYLTRDVPGLLQEAGFSVATVETGCMSRFPKSWSHCCWGVALAGTRVP